MDCEEIRKGETIMWEKIFAMENVDNIIKLSEETESYETISNFIEFVEAEIDISIIENLIVDWDTLGDWTQVAIAITHSGEEHASRFLMLMDTLSAFHKEGELK